MTLEYVRFKFHANRLRRQPSGHLYLRWFPQAGRWLLTEFHEGKPMADPLDGTVPMDGANAMAAALLRHLEAYYRQQESELLEHAKFSIAHDPGALLGKPGFRPITARRQWNEFAGSARAEWSRINTEAQMCTDELAGNGWGHPVVPVKSMPEIDPWTSAFNMPRESVTA